MRKILSLIKSIHTQHFRRSFISVLSALYALVVVILSLAFEVSGLVADNVNGERYHIGAIQ
uniref:ABC transporter permease n=1 Tax=Romanomermis culicivorax TaxID=13658 RepID=A0A915I7U5_ROMCU